jgi:hypothetical protein
MCDEVDVVMQIGKRCVVAKRKAVAVCGGWDLITTMGSYVIVR